MPLHPWKGARSPRTIAVTALVGLALAAAACSSASSSPTTTTSGSGSSTTQSGPVTLRLGYLTNLTHASALVGIQQGIFTKNLPGDVTLQTSTYNAGPAEVTAMLAGSLDAGVHGTELRDHCVHPGPRRHPDHLGCHLGRRGAGGLLLDHLSLTAQGEDHRDTPTREHPGRRTAHLAQEGGAHLPRSERRKRCGDHPPRGQLDDAQFVRSRQHRGVRGYPSPGSPGW